MKRILSVFLSVLMVLSCMVFSASAADTTMRFGSDHKFKIVVFADTQDDEDPDTRMISLMGTALDNENPDLVVFTGDNVVVSSKTNFRTGARKLLQPLIDRDIPYAYTFGNHDAQYLGSENDYTKILSAKQFMHSVYQGLGTCLTYDADSSVYGYGNCNIPVYASSGNAVAFNLWIIDSNMYANGGYDNVHQDQQNWFVRTDQALETQEGHKVNSLVFQHIVVPEVYNCLVEDSGGSKTYLGKTYRCELNSSARGYLGEWPCPPAVNSGEFTTLKNRGDVLGIVTGHDHSNSFVGTYQGIDFIQMPGMTWQSYGDSNARGYGVIELDERDTTTYSSHTVEYEMPFYKAISLYNETVPEGYVHYDSPQTYISEVRCAQNEGAAAAKNELTNAGFTVIDFDLNKGAQGQYIYMGYKTTTDYNNAIKDLRYYSSLADYSASTITIKINGRNCVYQKDGTDLNKGSGGDYIYACTTKDPAAGTAISSIRFAADTPTGSGICGGIITPSQPADLNNNTNTHNNAVYCFTSKTSTTPIDISALKLKYNQLLTYLSDSSFTESSLGSFREKMNAAGSFLSNVEVTRATPLTSSDVAAMESGIKEACAKLNRANVDGGLIYGIPRTMAAAELAAKFNTGYADVTVTPSGSCMGTGSLVNVAYENGSIQYRTVIFGDVNGDGWYDGTDATIVSSIADGMLTRAQAGEAVYAAADCNHDGSIDAQDVEILLLAGVLLSEVDQSLSEEELLTNSAYIEYLGLIDQNPSDGTEDTQDVPDFFHSVPRIFSAVLDAVMQIVYSVLGFVKAAFLTK